MTKEEYVYKSNEFKYYFNNDNTYKNYTYGKRYNICKCIKSFI